MNILLKLRKRVGSQLRWQHRKRPAPTCPRCQALRKQQRCLPLLRFSVVLSASRLWVQWRRCKSTNKNMWGAVRNSYVENASVASQQPSGYWLTSGCTWMAPTSVQIATRSSKRQHLLNNTCASIKAKRSTSVWTVDLASPPR